jgi:hypothetical protein
MVVDITNPLHSALVALTCAAARVCECSYEDKARLAWAIKNLDAQRRNARTALGIKPDAEIQDGAEHGQCVSDDEIAEENADLDGVNLQSCREACELLVSAYEVGKNGDHVDWEDVDEAWRAAKDALGIDDEKEEQCAPKCDGCEAAMVNGVLCHEHGCPNKGKIWDAEEQRWIKIVNCPHCDGDVEYGEVCECLEGYVTDHEGEDR